MVETTAEHLPAGWYATLVCGCAVCKVGEERVAIMGVRSVMVRVVTGCRHRRCHFSALPGGVVRLGLECPVTYDPLVNELMDEFADKNTS